MLLAMGAASAALDALTSLVSPKPTSTATTTGFGKAAATPFDATFTASTAGSAPASSSAGSSHSGYLSPATMSALLQAQGQSSAVASAPISQSDALKNLFSQLDADGNGQISKSEFENALGAGGTNVAQADDVFSKMDKNGDGSVSLDEMSSSLKGAGRHHHRHVGSAGAANGTGASNTDALLQALQGASSTSVTNSDGSTTTSLTYADGSKVTMTSPAATAASSTAASSYNFVEQAIQREAKALSASIASSLSVSV
jgi:Ca2+-binding EF-hand superfamily protein